jgi:ABC-2 type transport system permease protein
MKAMNGLIQGARKQYRQLALAFYLSWLGLKSAYEYRGAFWLQVGGMILNNSALMVIMSLLFSRFGKVDGWGIHDTLLVFGTSTIIFGGVQLLFANVVGSQLGQRILDGQIDAYMLFPQSTLFHVTTRKLAAVAVLVPVVILGMWVLKGASILVQSLTFWFPGMNDFGDVFLSGILVPLNYPEPAFAGVARIVLIGVFPAFFVGFLPAHLVRAFGWHDFGMLFGFALAVNVVAYFAFNRGLRHYESGNLFATNL